MSGQIYNITWFDFARDKIFSGAQKGFDCYISHCQLVQNPHQLRPRFYNVRRRQIQSGNERGSGGWVWIRRVPQSVAAGICFFVHFHVFSALYSITQNCDSTAKKNQFGTLLLLNGAAGEIFCSNLKWKSKRHWAATVVGRKESYLQ